MKKKMNGLAKQNETFPGASSRWEHRLGEFSFGM